MKILPDLPDLRILPTHSMQPHEEVDESRALPLAEALRRQGILKNPPIVLPFSERGERHIVLDGANRINAFRQLGLPDIVSQVVHAGGDSLKVETWNHIVLEISPESILDAFRAGKGLHLAPSSSKAARQALDSGEAAAYLVLGDGRVLVIEARAASALQRVEKVNWVVSAYQGASRLERTSDASAAGLIDLYDSFACLVVFPRFSVEDIMEVVAAGQLLPTGITRFLVYPRALHLNYPLDRLASSDPSDDKQRALEEWVSERVRQRRVRYYAEPTFLFDE